MNEERDTLMPAHPGTHPKQPAPLRILNGWRTPRAARRLAIAAVLMAGATAAVAIPAAAAGSHPAAAPQPAAATTFGPSTPAAAADGSLAAQPACDQPPAGYFACQAIVDTGLHWTGSAWVTGPAPASRPSTSPPAAAPSDALAPYMAADLQSAYNLPSSLLGSRQTVAIVDAYDNPNAAADLATYRAANDLPACGASFPCFEKVNQDGQQGNYPPADQSWALEESLDVDMVSAACPNCKIILVEADSNSSSDLFAAEDEAASLGANVISNSWTAPEYTGEQQDAQYFSHPGIAITAAAGDSGYGVEIPAAFSSVTAVGGTSLYPSASPRGWGQAPWQYTGSGCSAYIPQPAWQHTSACGMRAVADVSADADPDTPVAVYDSGDGGWVAVGGTSVGTPLIAGVYALAGNAATAGPGASYAYAHPWALNDVTAGTQFFAGSTDNGECGGSSMCAAGPGYDGPTGLGTPDGIGAF
jgi:subtilase family serine protease